MPFLYRFYTCLAARIILTALVITVVPVQSLAQQDDCLLYTSDAADE